MQTKFPTCSLLPACHRSAANAATFSFPNGGEWSSAVPVGLRVVDSNVGDADVSLAAIANATFTHNVHVSASATLDTGSNAFTFGPATAMGGLGTLSEMELSPAPADSSWQLAPRFRRAKAESES